ncbi:MAG: hypothetical protein KY439_01840 [Actinobacteria bacterium]|nr:hypothetical protein [Actinomycetota bacterium]
MDIVRYEDSKRSTVRGARVGSVLGVVASVAALAFSPPDSLRMALGTLMTMVSGGAMFGATLPNSYWVGQRPESKPRLILLLAGILVGGVTGIVLGAVVAGITGER